MGNLRNRFERFCYEHRHWGIPNLMLYIAIGSAVVTLLGMFEGGAYVISVLCFDKALILQGEVWRLFTYVFTTYSDTTIPFLPLIYIYFFYMFGRHLEQSMGSFRFTLYYFTGVLLMDAFAMIFFPSTITLTVSITPELYVYYSEVYSLYLQMGTFMHLSMVLTFATIYPDSQFLIMFILPVKAWILSIVYLVITAAQIYNAASTFPCNLLPLVGLLNFFLFAGKDALNLLPPAWRPHNRRHPKVKHTPPKRSGPIPFNPSSNHTPPNKSETYTHRCVVCGRTDVTNPELEFRYCSRCNGYHCYCEDHISNHTHIE